MEDKHFHIPFYIVTFFLALVCLTSPAPVLAQEEKAEVKIFPGLNEVVPQATVIAARVAEADAQLYKAEARDTAYQTLDGIVDSLEKLEALYNDWDEISSWRSNRLLRTQSSYDDLREEQKKPLRRINTELLILEKMRSTWQNEKTYWQEWQIFLNKREAEVPVEIIKRTLTSIDTLLKRITRVGSELVKAQQKYSPGQEVIASRLSIIDQSLDFLRGDVFKRNTFSIFEPNYYSQFNRELFTDVTDNLATTLSLPKNYLKRHGWTIGLQMLSIFIISLLLIYQRRTGKPIAEEWDFIFRRPLTGATFISIIVMGNFTLVYSTMPPSWHWLLVVILAIVAMRLINAICKQALGKKLVRAIAVISIITESLQYLGFPIPFLQLYHILLCALAIPLCWWLIRKRNEEMSGQLFLIYLILGVAIVGLISATTGFERFSSVLIDATLSMIIFFILVRIALRLVDGGIDAFMHVKWLRNRQFMQVLGLEEAGQKLQTLLKIVILANAGLTLLGIWDIFDSAAEARETLLTYNYSFGEFTFSVKMVVMVTIVLYLTTLFSWVIQAFFDSQIMTPKKMDSGVKESLKNLIHYGLFTIGFFIAVSIAGLDLQKFTIIAGALGVGIGFGMQNIVNNFISGLILLFERPVKVGDVINLGQDWGTISKIGLRSTVVLTFDRSEIIVPNADLIAEKVTNWSLTSKIVRVSLPVGVAYGSPLEKVLDILNTASLEHPEVLSRPEPNTIFERYGDSSIDFTLRFYVLSIDERWRILTEVAVRVDDRFREEGITIPFPQQDLHLRSVENELQNMFGEADSPKKEAGPADPSG